MFWSKKLGLKTVTTFDRDVKLFLIKIIPYHFIIFKNLKNYIKLLNHQAIKVRGPLYKLVTPL